MCGVVLHVVVLHVPPIFFIFCKQVFVEKQGQRRHRLPVYQVKCVTTL